MKKIITLLLLALVFVACEGPRGLDGRDGANGSNGANGSDGSSVNWKIVKVVVKPNQWVLMGQPDEFYSYFYADVTLPDLTKNVFDTGTVLGYIETEPGIKNGLPYTIYDGDEDAQGPFFWTRKYDFEFWKGGARFYFTHSYFITSEAPTADETFHVVMMW